jgi:uncharacterized DUF497 family protein
LISCIGVRSYTDSPARYEWNPAKAQSNVAKHGVRFADAVAVFADERALKVEDPRRAEERWVTIEMDAFARLVVVVYTWREDTVRLISARRATRSERLHYAREER